MRRPSSERGQASVELLGVLPIAVAVVLAAVQLLAAGATRELAGHAAGAGAIALLERADPRVAARRAVPGWTRGRMEVGVRGPKVTVRMRPPMLMPGFSDVLATTARADAGRRP